MLRHILVTLLIVFGVYTGLLLVIDHPFMAQAGQAQLSENEERTQLSENEERAQLSENEERAQLSENEERAQLSENEERAQTPEVNYDGAKKKQALPAPVSSLSAPLFKGPTIVGVSNRVDLNDDGQEVEQLWQQLLNDKVLQNNVNWSKGNIKVYAYYSDFDANFTTAKLAIGFNSADLLLHSSLLHIGLPSGNFKKFATDPETGGASQQAWAQAYLNKNLVERHTLNRNGEMVSADAIVMAL